MPTDPPNFTTTPKVVSREEDVSWGGSNGWDQDIEQSSDIAVVNGQVQPAVDPPAPATHHWRLASGQGETLPDRIGGNDGDRVTASWTSGNWVGGNALDSRSGDTHFEIPNAVFDVDRIWPNDFALAFTFQTTDGDDAHLFGSFTSDQWFQFALGHTEDVSTGRAFFQMKHMNGGDIALTSSKRWDDGVKHRLVFNKIGLDGTDWGIYDNTVQEPMGFVPSRDKSIDPSVREPWTNPFAFAARYAADGTVAQYMDCIIDDIVVYDRPLTASEIAADYNRQPWA